MRPASYLNVQYFSPEVLAETVEQETVTTEQLVSVYHTKRLSTISCLATLTAILTAEFFLSLADNGESQRQRVWIR